MPNEVAQKLTGCHTSVCTRQGKLKVPSCVERGVMPLSEAQGIPSLAPLEPLHRVPQRTPQYSHHTWQLKERGC